MPINHKGTIQLETIRLILRKFTYEDAASMFRYACDPIATRYMRFPTHQSINDSMDIIDLWVTGYSSPKQYNWAIYCKECNDVIGSIGFMEVNDFHLQAEVGYIIRRDHWGKGIASEALSRVISFAFDDLCFNRLESLHSVENPASGRVMQKSGMKKEGVKKEYFPTDNGYVDCDMYAITKSEYES